MLFLKVSPRPLKVKPLNGVGVCTEVLLQALASPSEGASGLPHLACYIIKQDTHLTGLLRGVSLPWQAEWQFSGDQLLRSFPHDCIRQHCPAARSTK